MAQVDVIMVPLPCQSHLNQLLQFAGLIAGRGHRLRVHFVGSSTHNRQVKHRSHGLDPNSIARIQFHDLPTPSIAAPHPDPHEPDRLPLHLASATLAYMSLGKEISLLVDRISSNTETTRTVIVYDRLMADAVRQTASDPKVELYAFNCISAINLFYILWEALGKPFEFTGGIVDLPPMSEFTTETTFKFIAFKNVDERVGDIHNTVRIIDSNYIDLLGKEEISGRKKQWAIRPQPSLSNDWGKSRHKCLDWLDNQAPRSVIYVSFGTTTAFTNEEAREIAVGLEQSKQKFIWVLRDADRADIFAGESRRIELPQGFEERVQENGIVVRDWAPQFEILSHKSTGGFVSHCGWNSCLESLTTGVPIATWPMHSDQPLNAIFLAQVLKTGLIVRPWSERREPIKSSVVKSAVERLMASDEGDEIRKRAEELGAAIKESVAEGGECYREIEAFIAYITR